jgi:DUF4097 and DUF4098 domain-containing protein YvlB
MIRSGGGDKVLINHKKNNMKKVFLILMISCATSSLFAQYNSKEPFLTKSLASDAIKNVEVETSGGNVSVQSVDAGQARVEVYIWPGNKNGNASVSKEAIQKILDEYYDLKLDASSNKLTATAKSKIRNMNYKKSLSISFKVFVTRNVSTDLSTSGGNIDITTISGEQKISTSGGNLTINNVKGKIKGTTSGGNIQVKDSDNDIDLTTSGGNVEANNCIGLIKLTTSGGNVELVNLNGTIEASTSGGNVEANAIRGDLEAHTSGGNVELLALACNLTASTSGGDITVTVAEAAKSIKIRNSGGKVALQLPAGKGYDLDLSADKIKTDNLTNFNGKADDDEMEGTINGGGTKVDVDANSGRLILTFK